MTRQFEEETGRAGDPFLRLLQPEEPNAPFAESSYFRLGSYVSYNGEEDPLVTHLHTTRSRTSKAPAAPGTSAIPTAGPLGSSFAAAFNCRTPGAAAHDAIPSAPIASSNDGILLYTDRDLHENVKGAVLQKYGQGQVTRVVDCDASHSVDNGKYDLYANNGINIVAGCPDNPSNINVIAQGHYIEKAYGDRLSTTEGQTHSVNVGQTSSVFVGEREQVFLGNDMMLRMINYVNVILGFSENFRLGGQFQFALTYDGTVVIGDEYKYSTPFKFDIMDGIEVKYNYGSTWKWVTDWDTAHKTKDWKKIEVCDIVICPGDTVGIKNRKADFCNYSLSKETIKIENNKFVEEHKEFETKMNDLYSKMVDATHHEEAMMHFFR